ncbi:MAG: LamG domain-containing protein [Phycisphaeraceae bacterium]|nr:LamG domain-containing protein [Phycisphaeraceae bacterium]
MSVAGWGEFRRGPRLRWSYAEEVLRDGPAMYLRLGEAIGGGAMDASGWERHGSYQGGVLLRQEGALAGDGDWAVRLSEGAYATLATWGLPSGAAARTIEAWVSVDEEDGGGCLLAYGQQTTGAGCVVSVHEDEVSVDCIGHVWGAGGIATTGWHHLVVVWESLGGTSDEWRIYWDGQALPCGTLSGDVVTVQTATGAGYLGRSLDEGSWWRGWIDEVAVYEQALSTARVAAHERMGREG